MGGKDWFKISAHSGVGGEAEKIIERLKIGKVI